MSNWKKLTLTDVEQFCLDTYEGEVILYDPTKPNGEQFYFNAQEHFSDAELNDMDWYQV